MKKTLNFVKKNFYFAIVVVVLLFVATFVIAGYTGKEASHGTLYTDVIEPKTQQTIQLSGNLDIQGALLMAGVPFVSGYWKINGDDVYYDGGNVGVGKMSPSEKLDVDGNIKASGTICDNQGCIGTIEMGVVPRGEGDSDGTINIGADRNCMAFVLKYDNPCTAGDKRAVCDYDSATGIASGSHSGGCGEVDCGYICIH